MHTCKWSLLLILAALTSGALANTYYSTAGEKAKNWNGNPSCWVWKDVETGETPAFIPSENDGHTWVLMGTEKLSGTATLPNTTWYWGSDGNITPKKGVYSQACNKMTYSVPTCMVYGCNFFLNGDGAMYLKGRFTFVNVGQYFKLYVSGANRDFIFDSAFKAIAAADVTIQVPMASSTSPCCRLNGDFSEFKGNFSASGSSSPTIMQLFSPTAMGDPESAMTNAFTLANRCKLVMGPDVVQDARRGISFNLTASGTNFVGTTGIASGVSTITTPLYGATGTLVKDDGGTVVFKGPVAMKKIVVSEGELHVAQEATLASDAVVTVEEGGVLRLAPTQIGRFEIAGDGLVTFLPTVVDYVPATEISPAVTTPVSFPDGFDPQGVKIPIALSQAIPLPLNETNRLEVAVIPHGQLTADEFVDETPKSCGLPVTWFEVETDAEETQHVYLMARPAIEQVKKSMSATSATDVWTDKRALHAGADYYNMTGVGNFADQLRIGSGSNGNTLSLAAAESVRIKGRTVEDYMASFNVGNLMMYAGSTLKLIYGATATANMRRTVTGSIFVDESTLDSSMGILLSSYTSTNPSNDVQAALSGSGYVKIYSASSVAAPEAPSVLRLSGDNTGFTGRFVIEGSPKSSHYAILVSVTNAAALGGTPAVFDEDAIYLNSTTSTKDFLVLRADGPVVLDDDNRGVKVNNATLRVADGQVLSINSPMNVASAFIWKDGPGTLAIGDRVTCSSETNVCSVCEGFVQGLSSDSFATLGLSFADLTDGGFSIDADATDETLVTRGFTPKSLILPTTDGTKIKVGVRNWTKAKGSVKRAIVTLPEDAPDLTDLLVPTHVKGGILKIGEPQTNGDGSTTYFATVDPSGLMVILH